MMDNRWWSIIALIAAATAALSACALSATGQLADASTAVYSRGARQHTVSVILPVKPDSVFAAMNQLVINDSEINILASNRAAWMLEVSKRDIRYNLQATNLEDDRTLLFVWLDTGTTGAPANDLALSAVDRICGELEVSYRMVER